MTQPSDEAGAGRGTGGNIVDRIRARGLYLPEFWLVALVLGILAGLATVGFRWAIIFLQENIYRGDYKSLASHAADLPWYVIVAVPVLGGLLVGQILTRFTPDGRVRSVAHVIEGAAIGNGRVERRAARASALASLITLSTGGSTGREGPVVHMGAAISTWFSDRLNLDGVSARDLMGCAVASAVAASFNAPLAGCIFALEVVLRHFAFHAFAPIAIASVAGAVIGRLSFDIDGPEFITPAQMLSFYGELPAFALLGAVAGVVAVVMIKSIFWAEAMADWTQERVGIPGWLRPAIAGLLLGLIALEFPHIIGVGYETTNLALNGKIALSAAIGFAVVKVIAVAITMGGRMGGGVFSPALMLGALTGLAFGAVATAVFPNIDASPTVYALAGMAAVAASVMGGPISTTLIAVELTGDWQIGIAVMVSVSLSTFVSNLMIDKSFFLTQIEQRGVHIAAGPQAYLLSTITVAAIMRPWPDDAEEIGDLNRVSTVRIDSTLETALPLLEAAGGETLAVVDDDGIVGELRYADALKSYADALAETAREEHA